MWKTQFMSFKIATQLSYIVSGKSFLLLLLFLLFYYRGVNSILRNHASCMPVRLCQHLGCKSLFQCIITRHHHDYCKLKHKGWPQEYPPARHNPANFWMMLATKETVTLSSEAARKRAGRVGPWQRPWPNAGILWLLPSPATISVRLSKGVSLAIDASQSASARFCGSSCISFDQFSAVHVCKRANNARKVYPFNICFFLMLFFFFFFPKGAFNATSEKGGGTEVRRGVDVRTARLQRRASADDPGRGTEVVEFKITYAQSWQYASKVTAKSFPSLFVFSQCLDVLHVNRFAARARGFFLFTEWNAARRWFMMSNGVSFRELDIVMW